MGRVDGVPPALRAFGSLLNLWPAPRDFDPRPDRHCSGTSDTPGDSADSGYSEDWHRFQLAWVTAWADALSGLPGPARPDPADVTIISEWLAYLETAPPRIPSGAVGGRHMDRVRLAADRFRVRRTQVEAVRRKLGRLGLAPGSRS